MPLPGMRCPPVCGHLSYRAQRKVARPSHSVLQLQMDALAGQFKNLTKTTLHAVKQLPTNGLWKWSCPPRIANVFGM